MRIGDWVHVTEPDPSYRTYRTDVRRPAYHDLEGHVVSVNVDGTFDVEDEEGQVFDSIPASCVDRACRVCNGILICRNCGAVDR